MRERLRTALDITLGATLTGWRRVQRQAGELAETGKAGRERIQARLDRDTETWREAGHEQLGEAEERVREELTRVLRGMHLVTREDLNRINRQITQLQARAAELERRVEEEEEGSGQGGKG
ncbi:MAG TPA: hypothetical protein VKA48_08265 [Gammaproteobacteria bacterium]|nr:hypothetical protein [Gammaproteobacteria bacterium]